MPRSKFLLIVLINAALATLAATSTRAQSTPPPPPLTYNKDVAPILQKHCQSCHRPGEAAPFSMLTYSETKPWATAMKLAVQQKQMPPWFADPKYGHFANNRSLTESEIHTIIAWANGGAQEGNPKDLPPAVNWTEGWAISTPDIVFQLPKVFHVPESGTVEYQYVIVPTGFTEDRWVQMAEVRPTDRAVVHHIIAYLREPGSNYFKDQKVGVFFEAPPAKEDDKKDTSALPSDFLVGYAPGQTPEIMQPGQGKLIKAGTDIVFEVHYTTDGKATDDQTKLGIVFANETPKERVLTLSAVNGTFAIPPGDPNYKVDATFDVLQNVKLAGVHPHMHTRGKDFEYRLVFPDGRKETILDVPNYNWHWQLWYNYTDMIDLPKGTKIECTAHFDNSADNPENPDPTKTVRWGQQNWDEMMVGFFNLVFDAKMPAKDLYPQTAAAVPVANN
jgi:hypothetical protein